MDNQSSVNAIYEQIILGRMKKIQNYLLKFIDNEDDIEENYQLITDFLKMKKSLTICKNLNYC